MGSPLKTRAAFGAMVVAGVLGCGLLLPGVALAVTDPSPQPDPQPTASAPSQTSAPQPTAAPQPQPTADPQPTAAAPVVVAPTPVGPTPEELALQAQLAAEAAAKRQAAALAAAQKAAAQLAAAGQRAQATWATHGKPDRLVIVRATSIDTVTGGRLTRHVVRGGSALGLSDLAQYLPSSWLSIEGGTAQLSAAMVLSKGVSFTIGGGGLTSVTLAGGATPDVAASIYTGGGRLTVHDVTVASQDPATSKAVASGPGRPFVVVSGGGTLDVTDATLSDLGTTVDVNSVPGVVFNNGATGSLVRTKVLNNSVGVELDRSQGVRIDTLTVSNSTSDGLVLRGDKGTTLTGITADSNAGNGVFVGGDSTDRPITGITATKNTAYGLVVAGQAKPQISNIKTDLDGLGGLRINRSSDAVISDVTLTDEPIGVLTHVSSTNVGINRMTITGGHRGVVIEKTTTGLTMTGSSITGTQLAVAIGGKKVSLQGLTVTDSQTGVAAQRGSADVTVTGLTLSGGKDGFVADGGTSGVVLTDLTATGVQNTAVRMLSPNAKIVGGRISGSDTGVHVEAATTITGTVISNVDTGIRDRATDPVQAHQVSVDAVTVGIDATPGAVFLLADSRVHALESIRGTVTLQGVNDLSLPALSVLGAIGVPLILLAVLLELIHAVRQRMLQVPGAIRRRTPPPLPAGAG